MNGNTAYIETLRFRKHQVIFQEGDAGDRMFAVEEGRVGIFADHGKPTEKLLTEIPAGAFFGEMAMMRGLPRSATAVAVESDTVVSVITWETLGLYFRQSPAKIVGIMQQMGERIQELSKDYMGACGAVQELSECCEALMKENQSLNRELDRLRPRTESKEVPFWKRMEGETLKEQDARFRKYIGAYQHYRSKR